MEEALFFVEDATAGLEDAPEGGYLFRGDTTPETLREFAGLLAAWRAKFVIDDETEG